MARSRRARENPLKTRDKVLIAAGGATLLGLGIFFLTRSSSGSTTDGSSGGGGGGSGGGGSSGGDGSGDGGSGSAPTGPVSGPTDSHIFAPPSTNTNNPNAKHARAGAIKPPGPLDPNDTGGH